MSSIGRQGAPPPAGTVAVLFSSEAGRYTSLFPRLNDLWMPDGTEKTFWWEERTVALNNAVEAMLKGSSYWIWFISEAHGFDGDILGKLLSRNEAIMSPIVVENYEPFSPKAWTDIDESGTVRTLTLDQVIGPASLIEVRGSSVIGTLVRRAVFEAMERPWFKVVNDVSADIYFNEKARNLGFSAFIDTTSRMSTMSAASVIPNHKGGRWELDVQVGDDISFSQPLRHR